MEMLQIKGEQRGLIIDWIQNCRRKNAYKTYEVNLNTNGEVVYQC